jgi:hypothetical protein
MPLARIEGFVTRAEAGLRSPRSVSRNVTPERGGVVLHWGGPAPRIDSHADCYKVWRAWQRYHMDTHRWVDIAYTMGPCQHGYVFAGRGAGVRTAANGTNEANQNRYAVVWIGGKGMRPTLRAVRAALWCVLRLRRRGAGRDVDPHTRFTGSECPGPELTALAHRYDGKRVSDVPRTLRPGDEGDAVVRMKARLRAHGYPVPSRSKRYGPVARVQVLRFKRRRKLPATATVGRATWLALLRKGV